MCPPSSGRNGKQVDDREREADQREQAERHPRADLDRLVAGRADPTTPEICSRCSSWKRRAKIVTGPCWSRATSGRPRPTRLGRVVGRRSPGSLRRTQSRAGSGPVLVALLDRRRVRVVDGGASTSTRRPSRSTTSVDRGLGATQPSVSPPAHCGCSTWSAKVSARSLRSRASGETPPWSMRDEVDRRRSEGALGRAAVLDLRHVEARRLLDAEGQHEQDHEGDQDVHRRPRGDHDDPLPDRLVVIGALAKLGLQAAVRAGGRGRPPGPADSIFSSRPFAVLAPPASGRAPRSRPGSSR